MDPKLQLRVQRYGWDRAVPFYEDGWQRALRPAQDALLKGAELEPGDRVLDLACGTGLVTFRAAASVSEHGSVVGTDISDAMIEHATGLAAENEIPNVSFRQMNAEELDFEDSAFDAVLCALGLMYFPDPTACISEMTRVAKPGGRVCTAVWGARGNCGWNAIFPIVDERVSTDVCPLFFQLGTGDILADVCRRAGLKDVSTQKITHHLEYESENDAASAVFSGGPVAMAYTRFDEPTRMEVHAEYVDSIAAYRSGEGYEIPGEFVVVTARK